MNYAACIAEGAAETAIIDILADHHLLIFDREEMLDEQVLRCRSASAFESRYLQDTEISMEQLEISHCQIRIIRSPTPDRFSRWDQPVDRVFSDGKQ